MSARRAPGWEAPLKGAVTGAAGGIVFWAAAELWPASIAVALAMLVTVLMDLREQAGSGRSEAAFPIVQLGASAIGALLLVFLAVLLRFNALMALSAAQLPFAVPPNAALGLVMVSACAGSRALALPARSSALDLAAALLIGFVPAALLGLRGLCGIATALLSRMAIGVYLHYATGRSRPAGTPDAGVNHAPGRPATSSGNLIAGLAEIAFYLGALAVWPLI